MGKLEQNDIINMDDASERNDIYAGITTEVCGDMLDLRDKRP